MAGLVPAMTIKEGIGSSTLIRNILDQVNHIPLNRDMTETDTVAAVRRFNRFYTRAIGVLERGYLGTPYTLAEGRVLYEIAKGGGVTAKVVGEITGLDAGYLSRIVARFERDGVVARERSAT